MVSATWKQTGEFPLTHENLRKLLDNEITAIRIRDFASPYEAKEFAREAKQRISKYYNIEKKVGYIGIAQIEYRWQENKNAYFDAVQPAQEAISKLFEATFDPRQRFIALLREVWNGSVAIAAEGERAYYAGIVRATTDGIGLHADWAPGNSYDYSIGQIDGQLGWNFFAEGVTGGATTVYNAPWSAPGDVKERAESYNLPRKMVDGATEFVYQAIPGDVVLFNSRNPHEIAGGTATPGASRVSIGSFVGRMPSGALVLWS